MIQRASVGPVRAIHTLACESLLRSIRRSSPSCQPYRAGLCAMLLLGTLARLGFLQDEQEKWDTLWQAEPKNINHIHIRTSAFLPTPTQNAPFTAMRAFQCLR